MLSGGGTFVTLELSTMHSCLLSFFHFSLLGFGVPWTGEVAEISVMDQYSSS